MLRNLSIFSELHFMPQPVVGFDLLPGLVITGLRYFVFHESFRLHRSSLDHNNCWNSPHFGLHNRRMDSLNFLVHTTSKIKVQVQVVPTSCIIDTVTPQCPHLIAVSLGQDFLIICTIFAPNVQCKEQKKHRTIILCGYSHVSIVAEIKSIISTVPHI